MGYLLTEQMQVGYGKRTVVADISLCLKKGEILTLLGPNGVGKSTILKSLTKQLAMLGGVCLLAGKPLDEWDEKGLSKNMSVVTTERIKGTFFTCSDIVGMGRYPYTGRFGFLTETDREKVCEALALVRMESYADALYEQLSDGQKQRILLAKAICQEPEILVLDEPVSYLDIRYKLELAVLLKRLAKEKNIAVVAALHEIDLAQRISDTVVCVKDGKIDRFGTPEEVYTREYIASLYDMPAECVNITGSLVEMPKVAGEPRVFVIGGGGSGILVYHELWRRQIPFAAGVLHENDAETNIARALAHTVVTEEAFACISGERYTEARRLVEHIGRVICACTRFGTVNEKNKLLLAYAKEQDLLTDLKKM